MSSIELRPLSLGELLDRTFTLYRKHFWLFVGIMAIPQLLVLIASFAGLAFQGMNPVATRGNPPRPLPDLGAGAVLGIIVFAFVVGAIFWAGYVLAQAATVSAVSEIYLGRPTSIGQAYRRVRGKVWTLIGLFFLIGLAVGVGMLVFIVPGILVLLGTSLGIPAAVLENLSPGAAFSRSMELTKGSRGSIFVIYILFFVLSWAAAMMFEFPFTMAQTSLLKQGQASVLLAGLGYAGNFLASTLVGPLATIAFCLLYYDARVRKEAFDLQVMMSALDAAPTPGVPPAATGA
jgi:hypothetical protein